MKGDNTLFETGFPYELQEKVLKVLRYINLKTYNDIGIGVFEDFNNEEYLLYDGSIISFPYRIYFKEEEDLYCCLETREERLIYNCIFTRSCDGYVRQKHLREILKEDFPEWCMPYILKLSSEYIEEIVSDIYEYLKPQDNAMFQAFCENNPYRFRYSYSRMTNYWNEFYRNKCNRFHNYVGYKLYKECFGYSRRFDRL